MHDFILCLISWYRLKCDEAPEEEPIVSREPFLKVECNIVQGTNYVESGIKEVCILLSRCQFPPLTHACRI